MSRPIASRLAPLARPLRWVLALAMLVASSPLAPAAPAVAVAIPVSPAAPFVQNFDAIGSTATATLPTDFKVDKQTTVQTVGTYAAAVTATERAGGENLSSTAGNGIYNFGAPTSTSTDRAIGFLSSSSLTKSGNLYGKFDNTSGQPLSGLTISYDVEKYRDGSNASGFQVELFYSLDDTTYTSAGAAFLTTFAADANNNGCATPPCATQSVSNQTLNVAIPTGGTIYLAWNYAVASGITTSNAQALAIDGINVLGVPSGGGGGDTAPNVSTTSPRNGQENIPLDANVDITFNEAVNVAGDWFEIACAISGIRTVGNNGAAVGGDPTTFTINPNANFSPGESCAVTIFAAGVTDQDTQDPPDTMTADVTFTFMVVTPTASPVVRIRTIQGTAHTSPLVGQAVTRVPGIVTAVRDNGFYFQDPSADTNDATSEGILAFTSSTPVVAVGNSVEVSGTVTEFRPGGATSSNLTTTELTSPTVVTVLLSASLPAPTVIGQGGRVPPTTIIDDDAAGNVETSGTFDPATDGIDFYESLEGMLVQVNGAVVVGPTNSFGEIVVLADNGTTAGPRTIRGGIKIGDAYSDFNPERIFIDDAIVANEPRANVGAQFGGPIVGVIDYGFGNFKLLNTQPLPAVTGSLAREVTDLVSGQNQVTVATFNVENLDPSDGADKFDALADLIVTNLRSPDVITLEEVQDNNGATNDGVVDASTTLQTLVAAIAAAGGPTYQFRFVNPVDDQDGGEPGGNIRVAFLFRTDRGLAFVDRPGGTPTTQTTVNNAGGQPQLSFSPGRIDPTNPAFNDSRKPLVGEFLFNGTRFFVIGNHFNSKGGDQPLFGRFQPPTRSSEVQRQQQAQVVRDFVEDILTIDANARVVVLGDLNDFEFSPAVTLLEAGGLVNLMETLPVAERYSYVFEGSSQVLDQVLVSQSLAASGVLAGYDVVRVNAEFFDQISDHDPQVARFNFAAPDATAPTTTATTNPAAPNGQNGWFTSDVAVTLTAADNPGGSGVKEIVYSASGAQTIQPTTAPGSTVSFPIATEGTTTISYFARDNNNTAEAPKTLQITLDKTPPTAQTDQYTAPNGGGALVVPAAQGVLANDVETVSTPLTAQVVAGPTKGQLALNPDGSFTYTPGQGQTGTDTFTYLTRNAAGLTDQDTATITLAAITPTDACTPRPPVRVQVTPSGGRLQVTISSTPRNIQQPNPLSELSFTKFLNARVTLGGQAVQAGQRILLAAAQAVTSFTVERLVPGQGTTVELTVVDSCGEWPTFVGGGPNAF